MNWHGMYTLFVKEVLRFMKVAIQTILTPVVTVLLYLLVFGSVLSKHVTVYANVPYLVFLVPGLMMMAVLQNAFANSSSSLFQSKMTGNVIFMLLSPLSELEIYIAYVGASIIRGMSVGIGVWAASLIFTTLPVTRVDMVVLFTMVGGGILGGLGLISAILAEKWDHIAAFQNFVVLPLSFLSGVFYSINKLPPFWENVSLFNPFFYLIDGFRFGFLGVSDKPVHLSISISILFFIVVSIVCLGILRIGYKMRT